MNKAKQYSKVKGKSFLISAFAAEQELLKTQLDLSSKSISHDGKMGEVNELHFINILRKYLPNRYGVESAIVIDSKGKTSDQIDIVIFDSQYTPTLLDQQNHRYIPAEAVYAVFEVKPIINKQYLEYSAKKAQSVRKLYRTSALITHVSGDPVKKKLFEIISGIIAIKISWKNGFASSFFQNQITSFQTMKKLDCGLAASGGCFDLYDDSLKLGPNTNSMAYFLFRLLFKLSQLGTAPAVDWNVYAKTIGGNNA